ncbi:MAG TPA: protein-glutamate O-methyltransferase CheR [Polyangia bacterium]|jgi:chemotaxis protein methyltransferase CheR|nr:protein-glutamate O-methyltransferase CheR [Polyangia bacterium]
MALPLSPQVFAIFRGLVEEHSGLHYGPADLELFAEKVSARAIDEGFESLLDYYYFLRYDDGGKDELERLLEALVVNETYFFREREQLEWVVDHLLVPRVQRGQRPRIWSAACATGEEPLTLAMLLHERGYDDRVDIVASDLSQRVLDKAQQGLFSARSLRHSARPELAAKFLEEHEGRLRITQDMVTRVQWRRLNLTRPADVAQMGAFDAILCRNVLIYFSDETTQRVLDSLMGRLRDDGVFLVGVSESLLRFGASITCEEHGGIFAYRPIRATVRP